MAAQSQTGHVYLLIAESAGGGFRDHRVVAQYGLATQYGQPAHTEHRNVDTEFVGATNFAGHIKEAKPKDFASFPDTSHTRRFNLPLLAPCAYRQLSSQHTYACSSGSSNRSPDAPRAWEAVMEARYGRSKTRRPLIVP